MAHIIFDFDGTLANSLNVSIEIINEMNVTRHLTIDDYYKLRNLPARQVLKELNVPLWRVPAIATEGKRLLKERADQLTLFDGIQEVVRKLSKNHSLYVVSSNSPQIVSNILKRQGLDNVFHEVVGNVSLFGKALVLKRLIKKLNISNQKIYYVGDETRDIDAAKKAKLRMIAVSWGYNGVQALQNKNPDYIVDTPDQIMEIITKDNATT